MTPEIVLSGLLVTSVTLGIMLLLVSMAALGRKVADLELQVERNIQGVPRIQAMISIRSQIGNVLLALIFVVINILLLAGAPMEVRTWTNRVLWTFLLAIVLGHAIVDWLAERKQVHLLIQQQLNVVGSYREMAEQADATLEHAAAANQHAIGLLGPPPLAPVLPEHSSPVTAEQRETARVATLRARLVAANLALGIAPEPEPPHEPPTEDVS